MIDSLTRPSTAPSALPSGWRTVRFGDIVRNVDENERQPLERGIERYVGLEHIDPESLHLKRWGSIADGTSFTRKFVAGQVLFGKRRAYQRKVAVAEFTGICSGDILVFAPRNEALIPELLPFIVQSEGFFQHALGTSAGSLSPRTRWRDLAEYEFVLPPLDEQRRIAEILWAADEVVVQIEVSKKSLLSLQDRVLTNWINGNLSKNTGNYVSLEDVCTIQSGQVDPTILPYCDMIHIAPDDIESNTGRILERKTAGEDRVTSGKYEFSEHSILYCKIRPYLRKVAIPNFTGICSADMYPIYAKPVILSNFLFHILSSDEFTAYAVANSVRSAIPKINRKAMMLYRFYLPSLVDQQVFMTIKNKFSTSKWSLDKKEHKSRSLKTKLLGQFFV